MLSIIIISKITVHDTQRERESEREKIITHHTASCNLQVVTVTDGEGEWRVEIIFARFFLSETLPCT